jgi:hypothetical protein
MPALPYPAKFEGVDSVQNEAANCVSILAVLKKATTVDSTAAKERVCSARIASAATKTRLLLKRRKWHLTLLRRAKKQFSTGRVDLAQKHHMGNMIGTEKTSAMII